MHNSTNLPEALIERIFMRLHGRFGNTFFNKFKIGKLNDAGDDAGIVNAKATWAHALAGLSNEQLKAGIETQYEHAPSCDEFKSKCVIVRQIEDYKALSAPVDREANKQYSANVVSFVAEKVKDKTDHKAWARRIIANPKNYPDISFKLATEALAA